MSSAAVEDVGNAIIDMPGTDQGQEPMTDAGPGAGPAGRSADGAVDGREAEIINHLLFHKAIIREPHDREIDLDGYMDMVRELDRGMHLVLDDPVDRAIAVAFKLVMDERFDPWNMDLAEFTRLYLRKLKTDGEVNFIIAGKLVLMAWNILRSQSENVLERADRQDEAVEDLFFEDWRPEEFVDGPPERPVGFGRVVLRSGKPPMTEAVRARDVRPVSLMNLLEAFEEAREEMALKERAKRFARPPPRIDIAGKLHEDRTQEDISTTWQRICRQGSRRMKIDQIWDPADTEDIVTVFISTLFLAKMEKVRLTQRRLPYGNIVIENIEGDMPAPVPEVAPATEISPEIMPAADMDAVNLENLAVV